MVGTRHSKQSSLSQSQSQAQSLSQSQLYSQSQPQSQCTGSVGDFDEVVNNMVCFLLVHNATLRPLKKTELIHQFAPPNVKGKAATNLIDAVKTKLQTVYGLDLLETEPQKFIVVNSGNDKLMLNELEILDGFDKDDISQYNKINENQAESEDTTRKRQQLDGNSDRILLILVLGALFHGGGSPVSESSLLGFLQKLHIDLKSKDIFFGDVTKKIHEFERQVYLKKVMKEVENNDSGKTKEAHYVWGSRATAEIGKKTVFEFLAKVYHKNKESMPVKMKQVLEESEKASS